MDSQEELTVLHLFAEASSQGFGIADLDGYVRYANPAMCRLLGVERPSDIIGEHISAHGRSVEFMRDVFLPTLLREGRWENEGLLRTRQGTLVPVWNSSSIIPDAEGRPAYIATVLSDISERKRSQDVLRHTLDQLQTVYDGICEGILITDVETKRFMRANASMCEMLGYREEELLALSLGDIHPPEEVPSDMQRFQAIAEGRAVLQAARPALRKDGSVFYADIMGHLIVYNGRPCVLALFRDITERKQAEEALRKQHRTLKHLLQSSDHERQVIAYEIHDGLAQQLAGAIMQFQTFEHLRGDKPHLAAKAYDAAMTMLRQGHFEARRLIAGVRPPILDESGVVPAVSHLVNEQSRRTGPKIDYHSRVDFDRLAPALENAIYRIAQEALNNACRHSKSPRVRLSLVQRDDQVRIEIRDWGVGFDVRSPQGNHFGLEGILQRAKLLGGRCSIRSRPGQGTRIVVELPLVPREDP